VQLIIHKGSRIDSLDAVRGFALIAMVFYHGLYDVSYIFGYWKPLFNALTPLEPPFAAAFIMISGVSSRFSHNNIKRGIRVIAFALIISAVTIIFMPSESIYFGILHFLGVAIILFELIKPAVDRISKKAALVLWSVLFALTYNMPLKHIIGIPGLFAVSLPKFLQTTPHIYALGFPDQYFYSADYFPIIPWIFIFLIGTVLGVPIKQHRLPEKFYTARIPFLATAGRNTLLIYVLHQPVLYGLLYAFFKITGLA
jgi:uncharacterized membrane protein